MKYRRSTEKGGTYFFTLVTYQRQPILTIAGNIERLREAFRRETEKRPFSLESIVIFPDHLHCIMTLPENDNEYSKRLSSIKRYFSSGCVGASETHNDSRRNKRERAVWQRRFWEHTIRDETDWNNHRDYIHFNPVKHGLVDAASEWPYSSFKKFVEKGYYSSDWGGVEPNNIQGLSFE